MIYDMILSLLVELPGIAVSSYPLDPVS